MKGILRFILILFPFSLSAYTLFLMTEQGEIAYSEDEGANWHWKSAYLPMTPAVDITSDIYGDLYYVSKNGEVYESTDEANTWTFLHNLPMSDAIAIWVTGKDSVYVLGENGDLYSSTAGWSLILNLGLSDFVDLIPDVPVTSDRLLAITSSGDVVRIDGTNASLIGNIGISDIVGGTVRDDTVFIMTYEGDIAYSTDGQNYTLMGSISQMGMRGIVASLGGILYATTEGGEVASSSDGTNWTFKGSANQVYIRGITPDTLSMYNNEHHQNAQYNTDEILSIAPNPARGIFYLYLYANKPGEREIFIQDITGRSKRLFTGFISRGTHRLRLSAGKRKGVYFITFGKDKKRIVLY